MNEDIIKQSVTPPSCIHPWSRSTETDGFDVYPGVKIFPMISGAQTNGEFSGLIEHVTADYVGAPHVHYKDSETVIITEGKIHMRISGEDITLDSGDWVHIPPGNPHSFKTDGRPSKWILLHHPGDPNKDKVGPPPIPPDVLTDRKKADKYFHENVPDFYGVPEHGFPGDPK